MAASLGDGPDEINAPASQPSPARVRAALDAIRPTLLADGGNVELVDVHADGTVRVVLQGACSTCPAADMTLQRIIEPRLRRQVPGVTSVVAG